MKIWAATFLCVSFHLQQTVEMWCLVPHSHGGVGSGATGAVLLLELWLYEHRYAIARLMKVDYIHLCLNVFWLSATTTGQKQACSSKVYFGIKSPNRILRKHPKECSQATPSKCATSNSLAAFLPQDFPPLSNYKWLRNARLETPVPRDFLSCQLDCLRIEIFKDLNPTMNPT